MIGRLSCLIVYLGGATIGIVVLSTATVPALTRKERFKAALVEIEAAITHSRLDPIKFPSDDDFDALIERTRKEVCLSS